MKKQKYICMHCGVKIIPENMYTKTKCNICHAKEMKKYYHDHKRIQYMNEYMRVRRWLNGGPDNHLLGDDIKVGLQSINGSLKVKI